MDKFQLRCENKLYAGTAGVSSGANAGLRKKNRNSAYLPGFLDHESGRIELARFATGELAPMHLIVGLPNEWVVERDSDGDICRLKSSIEAGFIKDGVFFSRAEMANMMAPKFSDPRQAIKGL